MTRKRVDATTIVYGSQNNVKTHHAHRLAQNRKICVAGMENFPWILIWCSHSCCYDDCLLGCDVIFTNVSKELPSSKYKKKARGRKQCRITRL